MNVSKPLPKDTEEDTYRHTMAYDDKARQEHVDPDVAAGSPVQVNPAIKEGAQPLPAPGQPPRVVSDILVSEWQDIMDQVTPEKVDFLAQELFQKLGVRDLAHSQAVVCMLYDQALRHVEQQPALAHFAHRLVTHPRSPQFLTVLGQPDTSFGMRRLLLNKVQEEYELGSQAMEKFAEDQSRGGTAPPAGPEMSLPKTSVSDDIIHGRERMLRNIKFMSHLFHHDLVSETTLHRCLQLLEKDVQRVGPPDAFDTWLAVLEIAGKKLYSTESPELAGALNMHFELLEMLQQEARETRGKGQLLSDRQWMRLKHVLAQRKTNWMQDVREPSAIL